MNHRQLAALETKKKLIDAARVIICEKGLTNTSVAEITRAAGVANGTFYTYFRRKEDIVYALSRDMFEQIFHKACSREGSLMERLAFFMISFSSYIEKSSVKLCQEWVRNTVDPDLVQNEDDRNKLPMDIRCVRELLAGAVSQGELAQDAPVDVLAHTLVDLLYGEMLCWSMSGGTYSFAGRTREFCDVFLFSLMKPYIVQTERK